MRQRLARPDPTAVSSTNRSRRCADLDEIAGRQQRLLDEAPVDAHTVAAVQILDLQPEGGEAELGVTAREPRIRVGDVAGGIAADGQSSRAASARADCGRRPAPAAGSHHRSHVTQPLRVPRALRRAPLSSPSRISISVRASERHDAERVGAALLEHGIAVEQRVAERRLAGVGDQRRAGRPAPAAPTTSRASSTAS